METRVAPRPATFSLLVVSRIEWGGESCCSAQGLIDERSRVHSPFPGPEVENSIAAPPELLLT
jgi:hypothetical protein